MTRFLRPLLTALFFVPFLLLVLYSTSNSRSSSPSSLDEDYGNAIQDESVGAANIIERSAPGASFGGQCDCDRTVPRPLVFSPFSRQFTPNESLHTDGTLIFLITPTYTRPTQMPDMTRLAQTLMLVPDIFWIVVEDAHSYSKSVNDLLLRSGIPFVHLLGPRPVEHMDQRSGRGVSNRLKAFEWLRAEYGGSSQKGVIYFADDDNSYDIRLFGEIRDTKVVSMFPVGMIATLGLSTPIVSNKSGRIIGFHDPFIGRRKFAVDMAGFAVNLQYFLARDNATMPYKVGYEEDFFLKSLGVQINELEPKAKNCTEVLVWHTKTKQGEAPKLEKLRKVTKFNETNLPQLYEAILRN